MHAPRLKSVLAFAGIAALALLLSLWIRNEEPAGNARRISPRAKALSSYRKDFPRGDGTLRSDEELAAVLTAKGVPFTVAGTAETTVKPAAGLLPPIQYESTQLTSEQKEQIEQSVLDILPAQLESLRQVSADITLGRLVVTAKLKLELHFSAAFARIADDETRLNDFSESLHSLGSTALKGNTIFIDGQPLGVYLSERDRVRDREAKAASPVTTGDGKR